MEVSPFIDGQVTGVWVIETRRRSFSSPSLPAAEGFATVAIDVTDQSSVDRARDTVLDGHSSLDTIVTMSGVMIPEDLHDPAHFSDATKTIDTVMDLLETNPTPSEILVKGVLMHRWAERDGTYDDLVAQRSQAPAMLPSRQ